VFHEVYILFHFIILLLRCYIDKESNHIAGGERMYLRTPWSRVVLEKLTGSQLENFVHFMEPEGSLPHSQVQENGYSSQ